MHKTIPFIDLYELDFNVTVQSALKQDWKIQQSFSCMGSPKEQNIFVCFNNMEAKYTLKNGDTLYATDGDIVFTPTGSEYSVEFTPITPDGFTVGVNALFYLKNGEGFIPEGEISIIKSSESDGQIFEEINTAFMSSPLFPAKINSLFYDMFSKILLKARHEKSIGKKFQVIRDGILFIESGKCTDLKIGEIADMSNVSEVYFRKLFREYSGVSPNEYIINAKIERAKTYLEHENISILEVSEILGFESESYFSRLFKKKVGISPIKYKNRN